MLLHIQDSDEAYTQMLPLWAELGHLEKIESASKDHEVDQGLIAQARMVAMVVK